MKKVGKLACACLSSIVFGLFPAISHALGLGEIHLHSYLNEPLSADIDLDDTKGIEASDIIIMVADEAAFEKAGLQPTGWLNHIRFQITKNKNGTMKIVLTTQDPVKDPFADLILQITWPGGKIVREYTLLLDPPKAVSPQAKVALSKATALLNTSSTNTVENNSHKTIAFGGQYGPVYDETLWSIAKRLVSKSGLSVHQAVMAIAYKNQQAFTNGNIKLIKQGSILNLPTQAEISNYSPDKAKNFVESQPNNWQATNIQVTNPQVTNAQVTNAQVTNAQVTNAQVTNAQVTNAQVTNAQVTNAQVTNPQISQEKVSPQPQQKIGEQVDAKPLKLLAPIGSGQSNTQGDAQRITLIEEAIDTLKKSNEDIAKKNQTLQSQNELLVNQLAIKEAEINRLKQSSGQETTSPDISKSHELLIKTPQQSHDYAIATPDTDHHHNEGLPENKPEVKREIVKPIAKSTANQTVQSEKHSQGSKRNIVSMVFLLALISSMLGWLWFSRHRIYIIVEWLKAHVNKTKKNKSQATEAVVSGPRPQDSQVNYGMQFDLDKALNAIVGEEKKFIKPQGTFTAYSVEEQDTYHKKSVASLEDAEIYIAYERYQQAEKILQDILGHGNKLDPIYWEAMLKCLELYVLTEKYPEYEKLHATIPTDLKDIPPKVWSKIVLLQEKVQADKAILLKAKFPQQSEDDLALASHHFSEKTDPDMPHTAEAPPPKVVPVKSTGKLELVKDDDVQSQISLAKAYIEVGDIEAARDLLTKVTDSADEDQKKQIQILLAHLKPK